MITRLYTWRLDVTDTDDKATLRLVERAGSRVARFNPNVEYVDVDPADDGIRVTVAFSGRDQWWIKRNVVFAIMGVLSMSKLTPDCASLIAVDRPTDKRSTRQRASDGRHNPIPDDQDIDHSDMGLVW